MLIEKIENSLKKLLKNIKKETFIFDFLEAYDFPKATISRLQKGDYNLSKNSNELIWKKKISFTRVDKDKQDPHITIDELSKGELPTKYELRFLIVTNFEEFLAIDLKSKQSLDIKINDLHKHVDFFLPLGGLEKSEILSENLADIKAAEKIGRLYDVILENNILLFKSEKYKHDLNIFLTRLLFCFFAEDSEIFLKDQFTNSIASHTLEDGSDLKEYFKKFFFILNTKDKKNYPKYLSDFPYVNGGMFSKEYKLPNFSKEIRKIIIQCGALDWSQINPDIFGSMLQAVINKDDRKNLGVHYTSVTNILKVIKPLFLDDLYEEFNNSGSDEKKLKKLLQRIYNIIIFDPACGSGNFLIISFKELCKLEIKIFEKLRDLDKNLWLILKSGIQLNQFFGIEKDDYAHEITKLSLWIALHQMNIFFKELFGETRPSLPLNISGNIFCGNATILEWDKIVVKNNDQFVYIVGNPPYIGSSLQSQEQKLDMKRIFAGFAGYKNLDYIACWFFLASKYASKNNSKIAFVSTSSIIQGEQVGLLWPEIFKLDLELFFAYKPFKWNNNAKRNAGVICVILGIQKKNKKNKILIDDTSRKQLSCLSPYLLEINPFIIIKRSNKSISGLQEMIKGNQPTDGGNLIVFENDYNKLIIENPNIKKFLKRYMGADELLNNLKRWCLWIEDKDKEEAISIPFIKDRVNKVKNFRLQSNTMSTKEAAVTSYKFIQIQSSPKKAIIIPSVSSSRRQYIPIDYIKEDTVISNLAFAVYNPDNYIFSLISSKMHMIWLKAVAGRFGDGFRYSSVLCYNSFPFPNINQDRKFILEKSCFDILSQREKYSEKTLAELYDPDAMPLSLLEAHKKSDIEIEKCYREKLFVDDDERLKYLFVLHDNMIKKKGGILI